MSTALGQVRENVGFAHLCGHFLVAYANVSPHNQTKRLSVVIAIGIALSGPAKYDTSA